MNSTQEGGIRPSIGNGRAKPVTLKALAQHLNLSPSTVSVVLNHKPVGESIADRTRERIFAAAREFGYRPNHVARSLRAQRSWSIGVLLPVVSGHYASGVMGGLEEHLHDAGFFCLVSSHRSRPELTSKYVHHLQDRQVEGMVLIAAPITEAPPLPTVAVAGHLPLPGVTNVVIDHDHAARLALGHLREKGHRKIAFFKGNPGSTDTEDRWRAICEVARELEIEVRSELTLNLVDGGGSRASFSPREGYEEGYSCGQRLLDTGVDFTALFAFNDISAIGAIRAFQGAGRSVPEDVSVVGFDDIYHAAFQNPSLTTVRQPLHEMGMTAGRTLLRLVGGEDDAARPGARITVKPDLAIRDSTAVARGA